MAAIVAVAVAVAVPVASQSGATRPKTINPAVSRTAEGHPDLQGVWFFGTLTPFERTANLAARTHPYERCILGFNAGPPIVPGGYNQNIQLVQTRDYLVIQTEMVHTARIIPFGERPRLPPQIASGTPTRARDGTATRS